jgi:hypothetical protein
MATTTSGYEAMRSGEVVLFYVNRDGLPLSDRCNDRMWTFCMEQYPKSEFIFLKLLDIKLVIHIILLTSSFRSKTSCLLNKHH